MRRLVAIALAAAVGSTVSIGVRCDPEKTPSERVRWVRDIAPARERGVAAIGDAACGSGGVCDRRGGRLSLREVIAGGWF